MNKPTSTGPFLTYVINPVPNPLQASPPTGDPIDAALTLIISNTGDVGVYLFSITVTIPPDLTSNPSSILTSADPERLWGITQTATPGEFLLQPISGQSVFITDKGIVFQFFNIPVSQQTGTVTVNIAERASLTNVPTPPPPTFTSISLTKFPYGFFFSNFAPSSPLVQNGNAVTLSWEGSTQAKYFMYCNDEQPVDVSNLRQWSSHPLTTDTTFLLKAITASNGQTVEKNLTTTVIVGNPDISASSIQVTGTAGVQGDTTLTGNAVVKEKTTVDSLEVIRDTTLNGNVMLGYNFASAITVYGTTQFIEPIAAQGGVTGRINSTMLNMGSDWTFQENAQKNLILYYAGNALFAFQPNGQLLFYRSQEQISDETK